MLYFTKSHEWIAIDGTDATIGISDYAQSQLGDIVFVELPEIGRIFAAGAEVAIVESVKAASEIYAPCDGTVSAVNTTLNDAPDIVNKDAEHAGWFFRLTIEPDNLPESLMDAQAYQAYIEEI